MCSLAWVHSHPVSLEAHVTFEPGEAIFTLQCEEEKKTVISNDSWWFMNHSPEIWQVSDQLDLYGGCHNKPWSRNEMPLQYLTVRQLVLWLWVITSILLVLQHNYCENDSFLTFSPLLPFRPLTPSAPCETDIQIQIESEQATISLIITIQDDTVLQYRIQK